MRTENWHKKHDRDIEKNRPKREERENSKKVERIRNYNPNRIMAKGMGFKAAAASVARKEGVSKASANAIIASGARKASPAAVRANPNLKNVSGVGKKK